MSFPAGEFPAESVHPPPVPAGHPLRPQHPHLRARQVSSHWWSGPSTQLSLVERTQYSALIGQAQQQDRGEQPHAPEPGRGDQPLHHRPHLHHLPLIQIRHQPRGVPRYVFKQTRYE